MYGRGDRRDAASPEVRPSVRNDYEVVPRGSTSEVALVHSAIIIVIYYAYAQLVSLSL